MIQTRLKGSNELLVRRVPLTIVGAAIAIAPCLSKVTMRDAGDLPRPCAPQRWPWSVHPVVTLYDRPVDRQGEKAFYQRIGLFCRYDSGRA